MKTLLKVWFIALLSLSGCSSYSPSLNKTAIDTLGKGINLGGTLEGGENLFPWSWGYPLQASDFRAIKNAGFQHVRVPIGWSYHETQSYYNTLTTAPYTIHPDLFKRVDWVIQQSLQNGLKVIIDNHHHDDLFNNIAVETPRYLAIWKQIAERYKNQSNMVYFELLNEPGGQLWQDPVAWNRLLRRTITLIRQSNPTRPIIVGGVLSNSAWALPFLSLPTDPNLIATFHYYSPYPFTHQGAAWAWPEGEQPTGQVWTGGNSTLAADWKLGGWSSTYSMTGAKDLEVDYEAWGGIDFQLELGVGVKGFSSVSFKTDRSVSLAIACDVGAEVYKDIQTVGNWGTTQVAFSDCGGKSALTGIKVVNPSNASQTVIFRDIKLHGTYGTVSLLTLESEQLAEMFNYVSNWARLKSIPVYLGEFGVSATPSQAGFETYRSLWVKSVRQQAEAKGFGWAYWAFSSTEPISQSFGIYDRTLRKWHPLLRSLIPLPR